MKIIPSKKIQRRTNENKNIAQLENELLDKKTLNEKDQILWDQKSKFIEQ